MCFAPMLFPNLALLCGLGLWVLRDDVAPGGSSVLEANTDGGSQSS